MKGKLVLVVEDNGINMKLIRGLLQLNQYEVLEAGNAEEGIELAKRNRPDLILMDIQLPGMDGYTATQLIKKDKSLMEIPVIALTAHAMAGDEKKALEVGCDAYITKPIDTRTFPVTLKALLKNKDGLERRHKATRNKSLILIVDDNPVDIKLLSSHLSSEKYHVHSASSGKEALLKASEEAPDIILLDIMMPDMDGYEITEKLKQNPGTTNIPVILVTGMVGKDDKLKGLKAGADDFINKPVNQIELLPRIRSLLTLKRYKEQVTNHSQLDDLFISSSFQEGEKELKEPPTVLLVEDSKIDANLVQSFLHGMNICLEVVSSAREALAFMSRRSVDIILLDILLPDMDGFTLCSRLKNEFKDIQVLALTCLEDMESKIKGIEHGMDDFLVKSIHREELRTRLTIACRKKTYLNRLISDVGPELSAVTMDQRTGLYNPSYFKRFINLELKRVNLQGGAFALILMDIDGLKKLEETPEEKKGDEVLKKVGHVIKRNTRATDVAARYGEGFAIALPYTDWEEAEKVAGRLRKDITESLCPNESLQLPHPLNVSMGIAEYSWKKENADAMIHAAEQVLSRAKSDENNRTQIYKDIPEDMLLCEKV